jgi:hypothetical protein
MKLKNELWSGNTAFELFFFLSPYWMLSKRYAPLLFVVLCQVSWVFLLSHRRFFTPDHNASTACRVRGRSITSAALYLEGGIHVAGCILFSLFCLLIYIFGNCFIGQEQHCHFNLLATNLFLWPACNLTEPLSYLVAQSCLRDNRFQLGDHWCSLADLASRLNCHGRSQLLLPFYASFGLLLRYVVLHFGYTFPLCLNCSVILKVAQI